MPLYTAEQDDALAAAAAALFADDPDVHVLRGDWLDTLPPHAPFDLLFVDGGGAKDDPDAVLGLAAPGATIVMDDFSADWPARTSGASGGSRIRACRRGARDGTGPLGDRRRRPPLTQAWRRSTCRASAARRASHSRRRARASRPRPERRGSSR